MNLSIAVCDDEPIICNELASLIQQHHPDYRIQSFHTGQALLSSDLNFDLLLLDIEMPDINGMDLSRKLRTTNKNVCISFISNHTELMPDAFKVRAFRFLKKPIVPEQVEELLMNFENELLSQEMISFHENGVLRRVWIDDVICFEAFGDGTYIYTRNATYETSVPLKNWVASLPPEQFFQTHKSYLISLRHMQAIQKNEAVMNHMKMPVPISRRKLAECKRAFLEYTKLHARVF